VRGEFLLSPKAVNCLCFDYHSKREKKSQNAIPGLGSDFCTGRQNLCTGKIFPSSSVK
jgi:hypothetical protein